MIVAGNRNLDLITKLIERLDIAEKKISNLKHELTTVKSKQKDFNDETAESFATILNLIIILGKKLRIY